ncbi:MAG: hypothetical protein ACUVTD_02630 [Nitrososphaerales archaeon]
MTILISIATFLAIYNKATEIVIASPIAGFFTGILVGMSGMGAGAILTPLLIY